MVILRAEGNPNHVSSGPQGGQFTSGGGSGGHGKHYAKRQRRKKKLLDKLRHEGHAKIAKVKSKQRKERNALRTKQRKEGTGRLVRKGQTKDLAAKHAGERKETLKGLKADVRKEASAIGAAKGKSSEKAAQYKASRDTALKEQHANHIKERRDVLSEQRGEWKDLHKEQRGERIETKKDMKAERVEQRAEHKTDRADRVSEAKESHKGEARDAHEDYKLGMKDSRKTLQQREKAADKKVAAAGDDKAHVARIEVKREAARAEHKETKESLRQDRKDRVAELREYNTKALQNEVNDLHKEHKTARQDLKDTHHDQLASLGKEHQKARDEKRKDHQGDRDYVKSLQADERTQLMAHLKREHLGRSIDESHVHTGYVGEQPGELWTERTPCGLSDQRLDWHNDDVATFTRGNREGQSRDLRQATRPMAGRFHASRVHKASSAEAILKHCLRQLGYTRRWREGRLTGRQHLRLLESIRQYGRAWMRHEAEMFFEHYGVRDGVAERSQESLGTSDGTGGRLFSGSSTMARTASPAVRDAKNDWEDIRGGLFGGDGTARSLSDRILSPLRRWFDRAKQFIRELIFAGAQSMAGQEPLGAQEAATLDRQAEVQAEYLEGFRREIEANPPAEIAAPAGAGFPSQVIEIGVPVPRTVNQVIARAELYGNAAHQAGQQLNRTRAIQAAIGKLERRVLGHPKTEHCHDCPPLAALGWQPVGTLPAIGATECGGLCLCHFEYQDPATGQISKLGIPRKIKRPTVYQRQPGDLPPPADETGGSMIPGEPEKPPKKGKPVGPAPEPEPKFVLPPGYTWIGEE